jgi:hypothetical protein
MLINDISCRDNYSMIIVNDELYCIGKDKYGRIG